jgi:Polyketide cyclase / dehydrase and lipid transport
MSRHTVTVEEVIDVPASLVYSLIADYRNGHPLILPRPPFESLDVEQGGTGAGTIIRFEMRAFGRIRTIRAAISEPEPGRVLVETAIGEYLVTTFTVDSLPGNQSRVVIATEMEVGGPLLGWLRRRLVSRFLRPLYVREIEQLGSVATERAGRS